MLLVVVGEAHVLQLVVKHIAQHIGDLLRQRVGGVGAGEVEGSPAQAGGQESDGQPDQGLRCGVFPVEGFRNFVEPHQRIYGSAKEIGDEERENDGQSNGDVCEYEASAELPGDAVYA